MDDMLDVAEEEATEDIQKFGGMEALDEPYMRIPLWRMVRKRAGWLVILFLGEMLTATAMANYQDEIAKAVVLALFLPLIISSGGNSRFAGIDFDHPRDGAGRSDAARLVAGGEPGIADWLVVRPDPRRDRRGAGRGLVDSRGEIFSSRTLWPALAARRDDGRGGISLAWCSGVRSPGRCCRLSCAGSGPTRQPRPRRSSPPWSM